MIVNTLPIVCYAAQLNLDLVDAGALGAQQRPVLVLHPVVPSLPLVLGHADPGVRVEKLTVKYPSITPRLFLTEQILQVDDASQICATISYFF